LSIVAETAWFDVHVKIALAPTVTLVGEADNVTVGAADVGGVAADDPHPLNKPVIKLKTKDNNAR
jgi:hypothetical protein